MAKLLTAYVTDEEKQLAETIRTTLYRYDNPPDHRIVSLDQVTDADIARFWREGYLVVDRVFSDEMVQQCLDAIMDVMFERVKGPKIQFVRPRQELHNEREIELAVRKVSEYVDYDERLRAAAYLPELFTVLERLLGESAILAQDQAILKPPAGGVEKPWHQDMAYGNLTYEKPVIGVWTALDPATADNGCMHVIPRSHQQGAIPHYSVRDWQICDTHVQVEQDVIVELPPGGALLFHGMLHHGTPPNLSETRRRSIQCHYAPASATKMSPKEYKRWFTNEMSQAEC